MGNDGRTKLVAMINYWIAHNEEHSQEFKEWADRANGFGEIEVCRKILQAAREMDKASETLSQVLSKLEKKEL